MRTPSLKVSLIPVLVLVLLLSVNVYVFHDNSSYGPNQLALFFAAIVAAAIGVFHLKLDYKEIEKKAMDSVGVSMQAMMILLVVGSLIGVWILNGVVPSMIYYGVVLINPTVFLPITLLICVVVSLATGSSWSTVGTVGIALIGIGQTLNIPLGMVGGAIVSGAYFGDKMSPLSETTNLAPAMAGTDLFSHIRHMVYTSGPAIIISFILFAALGLFFTGENLDTEKIESITLLMQKQFTITPWLFTLPLIVFYMVKKHVPALPALVAGVILGIFYAGLFQIDHILELTKGSTAVKDIYAVILKTAFEGHVSETGNAVVDKLFTRGGMSGMLNTIWLVMSAMIFGGMLEVTGMLQTMANAILKAVTSVTSLVASTIGTSIFLNLTTSDQYIAIVLTGRMFKTAYAEQGLDPKNLSRAVEDGATVTSVLVPWNTCGAYFSSVMGIATVTYLPFAFFNILSPLISIALAASGKTMDKIDESV